MIYGGFFDLDNKEKRKDELDKNIQDVNFWNSSNKDNDLKEYNELSSIINQVKDIKNKIVSNIALLNDEIDNDMYELLSEEYKDINNTLDELKMDTYLAGEYDKNDCFLEIHAGAGGTEACDWANMLYRMYDRWCLSKGYSVEVLDILEGEEAGIKRVTLFVKGVNAYGYLKCEKGVHRLIRLSPFNANNKRQTSFVSIDVEPILENNEINIDINPNDIRIDIYRSSGNGGQGVNTTDSAVRITHIPTKIVVTCQNERSQIQNKEKAMEVLKSKLYVLEQEKKEKELKQIKGDNMDINFGSQIRTYTLHPYSLVKDHRTNKENINPNKVLDGDIDDFISECLKRDVK